MSDRAPISRASAIDKPESLRESTRLLLLSNESMRARRRPFSVLLLAAFQLLAGLAIGWPAARTIAQVFEKHPAGDAPLFDDGGFALVRSLGEHEAAVRALGSVVVVVLCAVSLLGLVPVIAAFASLAHTTPDVKTPRARHLAPFVASTFGPMAVLWLGSTILKGLALALVTTVFAALSEALASRGDAVAEKVALGVALLLGLSIPAIDAFQDLTRAALVRFSGGLRVGLRLAFRTVRARGLRTFFSYLWRSAAGLLPVAAVALLASKLGGKAGGTLIALVLLHQSVVFARSALRVSWYAAALRAVDDANSD